jgi:hypothetical protein
MLQRVYCLADIPLFFAPLPSDAAYSEIRRYFSARLEKLIGLRTDEFRGIGEKTILVV